MVNEQNIYIATPAMDNSENLEKFEISTTLNECVKELSSYSDIDEAIHHLLGIVNDYFKADRTYIFKFNDDGITMDNTYEYEKDDSIAKQIDNLHKVPRSIIRAWMEAFESDEAYYVANIEDERVTGAYEILRSQDIKNLIAVPLWRAKDIYGFVGVDNPKKHYKDATLLSSIQFFISNSPARKAHRIQWFNLSYRDSLTGLFNRNKYTIDIKEYKKQPIDCAGVAFIDLNGLKKANDMYGHEAGDDLLRRAAEVLNIVFRDKSYRIGGDEFVVVTLSESEKTFKDNIVRVETLMAASDVSLSLGSVWQDNVDDLSAMLKKADAIMYENEKEYHKKMERIERQLEKKRAEKDVAKADAKAVSSNM